MKNKIRRATSLDAEGIIKTLISSIQKICSKDYTPEEIKAWSSRNLTSHQWQDIISRDIVWVVENDWGVQGFAHLALMDEEHTELLGLYLKPDIAGLGHAKELITLVKKESKSHGAKKITLLSPLTAKTFYDKMGFFITGGMTTLEMQGIPIACYPMECEL